ncbi:T6SS effector phospholipase Tle3 domain-containing protein [Hafnia alvei]|uniref:T6SS effector phospholipase Tle3 domain-containing protein n=1 Tax=Hafnia alvei TaxID=569 RepID=UPI00103AD5F0|nr:DUF3274 domain-containing protein [Hafnia alvei]QBJ32853.1 DUF3274 domain-containing protein [Hafnia alvei]
MTKPANNTHHNESSQVKFSGVPTDSGEMVNVQCAVQPPMPCMTIVIHGVNDNGLAYRNIDNGICKGLNTRLGRTDLTPHQWGVEASDTDDKINLAAESCAIQSPGRSPIIPFYWGYRPVDYDKYHADQVEYKQALHEKGDQADLPYDAYVRPDAANQRDKSIGERDNYDNPLKKSKIKGGGPFPNATNNIPDMYGPGSKSLGNWIGMTQTQSGDDYSSFIHENPHRIYYVHAAQRLAKLILQVRQDPHYSQDTINIIAHSQGTIITMLAQFMVAEEGSKPADCIILNNSPYGVEDTFVERLQRERGWDSVQGIQSKQGREQTLINFVQLMEKEKGRVYSEQELIEKGVLVLKEGKSPWQSYNYPQDNFGHVYNYFCPYDNVVSLSNVQGFGWQGIDDTLLARLGDNFFQRVFSKDYVAGDEPKSFDLIPKVTESDIGIGNSRPYSPVGFSVRTPAGQTASMPVANVNFGDRVRTINAPKVPEPVRFELEDLIPMGKEGERMFIQEYMKTDPDVQGLYPCPPTLINASNLSRSLTPDELQQLSAQHPEAEFISARFLIDMYSGKKTVLALRHSTEDDARAALDKKQKNSQQEYLTESKQHSAIMNNPQVPEKIMAYDLAIGMCACFADKDFWHRLLYRADWKNSQSEDHYAVNYYQTGLLPEPIKPAMNKPYKFMPKGVVNDYLAVVYQPGYHSQFTTKNQGLQWPMPDPDLSKPKV